MNTQICDKCNYELPITKFEWASNRPNPRKTCMVCRSKSRVYTPEQLENKKLYRVKYRESGRAKDMWEKSVYGVCKSELEYSECVICGSSHRICIDHNHTTGKFRGLLCATCNGALGLFHDSVPKLENAIKYLEHFNNGGDSIYNIKDYQLGKSYAKY